MRRFEPRLRRKKKIKSRRRRLPSAVKPMWPRRLRSTLRWRHGAVKRSKRGSIRLMQLVILLCLS